LIEVLKTDTKPNECHKCGTNSNLTKQKFGIARILSTKRDWTETVARAGVSAVSIALAPVIGFVGVSWKRPDKTVTYRVLNAELVLCEQCLYFAEHLRGKQKIRDSYYNCHPWSAKARALGYDNFLSAEELAKLKPNPPK
jgi:hypothetical protein